MEVAWGEVEPVCLPLICAMAKVHPTTQLDDPNKLSPSLSNPKLQTQVSERSGNDSGGSNPNIRATKAGLFDFANAEDVKHKVRSAKLKPQQYDVKNFYHETGFFQWLASHPWFENITLGVISLNAIWIGVDTDHNPAVTMGEAEVIFALADSLFLSYFTIELGVRFMAFKRKINCMKDPWFMFDTTLVALYWFDPVTLSIVAAARGGKGIDLPTSILRLFRLARLSRLVRLLRSLPELMILVKGIFTASTTVAYTMGLLMLFAYVFGIALTQLSDGCEFREMYFSSVPHSIYSLIIFATFLDDLAAFGDPIKAESTVCLVICTIYIVLASMTVMNMLIGVLCEVIEGVARAEREGMMCDKVHENFGEIMKELDANSNGMISWAEFNELLSNPAISAKAIKALESVNVDVENMIDIAEEYFFYMGEPVEMSFKEFMEMVLELRGGQQAMVKDVVLLGKRFSKKFSDLKFRLKAMSSKLDHMAKMPRPNTR